MDVFDPASPTSYLPMDIIINIIIPKLPLKPLVRFKTVCKSFNSLISSHEFIRNHLRHSPSFVIIPSNNRTLYSFDLDSLSATPSNTYCWTGGIISVVGSCNGILLITRFGLQAPLMLLNPSNLTYIDVHPIEWSVFEGNLGFGYDHALNDYKIVLVTLKSAVSNYNVVRTRVTMVYSINSMSWKVVDQTFPSDPMEERYGGVLVNSHLLHWTFKCEANYKRRIGCFDVCTETWKDDVVLPSYYYDPEEKNYLLDSGVFDRCLFCTFENRANSCLDLWVMKEYGVQQSWVKLLTISSSNNPYNGVAPIAIREAGSSEVLIWQHGKPKLIWYNSKDNEKKLSEVPNFWDIQPYVCKTSLVTLPGAKRFLSAKEWNGCPN